MLFIAWMMSLLSGYMGVTYLVSAPLSIAAFGGFYSMGSFKFERMTPSTILVFPLSVLFFMSLGALIAA